VIIDYQTSRPGAAFEGDEYASFDRDLFADVVRGTVRRRGEVDGALSRALAANWPLERLERILRDLLRCGAYELLLRRDVPARVVINEYLEVAHAFFGGEEPGLVNAVLDRIARRCRAEEFGNPDHERPA
jgi:N utilization substance protein B